MRPTKLTIQGLTAYRQKVEIDFSDLDLFAITGPTGAGKSSLVDAITFALFGRAPRVGREIKEMISQGADRLEVELHFSSNSEQFRVHRTSVRKGQGKIQLERYDRASDEWHPEEDRVKEANEHIERVLQMDYDAFVRSVLLPQGEFQEFLAGSRDERRKVLDGLLQLDIYQQMQRLANALVADQSRKADAARHRLDTELADATPDALKTTKAELKQLKARADELVKLREATDNALRIAEAFTEAQRREREAREALTKVTKALDEANDKLNRGSLQLAAMDAQIAKLADEIATAKYDGDLHVRLAGAVQLVAQVEDSQRREATLAADIERKRADVEKLRAEVGVLAKLALAAAIETKSKQDDFEQAQHNNATVLLTRGLKRGDPCPVCGQAVPELPKSETVAAAKLKAAWEKSQAAEKSAVEKKSGADGRLAVEEKSVPGLEKQLAGLRSDREAISARLAGVLDEPGTTSAALEKRIESLKRAKSQREALEAKKTALANERDAEAKTIDGAKDAVRHYDIEAKAHGAEAARAARDAEQATAAIAGAAKELAWDDVSTALGSNLDVANVLRQRATNVQTEEHETQRSIGAGEKHIEQVEKEIETAKHLRDEEKTSREQATVARDLASLLRADSFPAFLRERAMGVLAEAGSAQLRQVSGGRYDLIADGQDFAVEDLWNASEPRPVRTLSGGETFLASLALALALAEHLPALAGNGQQNTLESLFIDEGFSHLDADTLDVVASALEVLGQDRNRLIGVVTHVPALAERMPARITVHKSQGGSTVTVE